MGNQNPRIEKGPTTKCIHLLVDTIFQSYQNFLDGGLLLTIKLMNQGFENFTVTIMTWLAAMNKDPQNIHIKLKID
jgi:hypothetical protein